MGTIGGNVCVDTRCNYYSRTYEWRKAVGFCTKKDGAICLVAPGSPRCWAVSSSDTAPVLWSLGARVRLHSPTGERTIPVEALFRDDGIEYLAKRPDEILTEILLPPADGWRSAYLKPWRGSPRPAGRRRRSRDHARRAHQGPARRARAAAAPARGEGGPHAEHGVADRVGAAHAVAPHAGPDRGGARRADRRALRRPARRLDRGDPPEGLPRRQLRRLDGALGGAGRRALPGQDPRGRLDARAQGARGHDREGRHQARPDEALLRDRRQGRPALHRRPPPARGR